MLTDTLAPSVSDNATTLSRSSATFQQLVMKTRGIVQDESDAERIGGAIADLLAGYLDVEGFLTPEQLEPDPVQYRQHILHVESDGSFSIVALVWLPGQRTCIHDHVSWCVVGVHSGAEHETRYELRDGADNPHLVIAGHAINPAGSVAALVPPGDIHVVGNDGDGLAVSLHIYGADIRKLGCSIRRRYDLPVR